jgi:threonine dehydrogenase-like Zn-dependent dehydrogenase
MLAVTLAGRWEPRPGLELSTSEQATGWARDARQVWRHPSLEIGTRALPKIEHPHDVLVKVHRVGIARSTVKMAEPDADGYVQLPYNMRLPIIPGHEMAGEVVELGSAVADLRLGEPVTVEALRPCGRCGPCKARKPNHCLESGFAGLTLDGGMAEYVVVPEWHLFSLTRIAERYGTAKAMDIGAVCEPAAVAYVGMFDRAGGFQPGASVAVFGCGPIGLAAIALARCAGAASIIAFDRTPSRLAIAREFGADLALDLTEIDAAGSSAAAAMAEASRGEGIAFAVEATGDGEAFFAEIDQVLAVEAKVLSLGVERKPTPIRLLPFQQSGSQITGMLGHIGGFEPVIALHAGGRLDLSRMIEARYDLADAKAAFAVAARFQEAKVVLHPQGDAPARSVA